MASNKTWYTGDTWGGVKCTTIPNERLVAASPTMERRELKRSARMMLGNEIYEVYNRANDYEDGLKRDFVLYRLRQKRKSLEMAIKMAERTEYGEAVEYLRQEGAIPPEGRNIRRKRLPNKIVEQYDEEESESVGSSYYSQEVTGPSRVVKNEAGSPSSKEIEIIVID